MGTDVLDGANMQRIYYHPAGINEWSKGIIPQPVRDNGLDGLVLHLQYGDL